MIDWQKVVLNIQSSGMPLTKAAQRVGMDGQTLRHYARGECKEPRFSQAAKLLDLHYERCPARHHMDRIAI